MEGKEKKAFFKELYKVDDESDGPEDSSKASMVLARSKLPAIDKKAGRRKNRLSSRPIDNQHLRRNSSAPIGQVSVSFAGSTAPVQATRDVPDSSSVVAVQQSGVKGQTKQTTDARANVTKQAGKKRKRGYSFNGLPDSQQIFKGLSFYFFPNDDVAPLRRFRIQKAMEWGAVWIQTWRQGITHVIVDQRLSYKDLLSFLKMQALPTNIAVVNEDYPPDCIRFRFVVNPQQPQYRIAGQEEAERSFSEAPTTPTTSLRLKPDKHEMAQCLRTPSKTDESPGSVIFSVAKSNADPDVTHITDSMPSSTDEYARDALSEAIEEAQAVQRLPIDLDEDEDSSDDEAPGDTEGEPSSKVPHLQLERKTPVVKPWQRSFACMTKHDGSGDAENPNSRTIEILQQMADYYNQVKDQWRSIAYRKAISALKRQRRKIMTAQEAVAVPFIGQRLADKIEEIVWTDRLRRLDNTRLDINDEALLKFIEIYSVGYKQASKWVHQGHRTLDDLLSKEDLTSSQRIGIEHLEDFQSRIPREEVDRHRVYVGERLRRIDADAQLIIGGSYRRGAPDCGDVDFIVTKPGCSLEVVRAIMVDTVIPRLFAKGYLKAGLAISRLKDGTKWHGAAALPGATIWRRVDFLFVPWDELGAALLYSTGNDIFNRSIRLLANKKGMRLNQHGLWKDSIRGRNRERLAQGTLVEAKDEKKIFELLGVPWRPPEHRIC